MIRMINIFTTLQHFVPQQQLSKVAGKIASSRHRIVKRVLIESFAKAYKIELDDYQRQDAQAYDSFNDFFTRELQVDARPVDATTDGIACPADGVISQLGNIDGQQILQAKGRTYRIEQLLASRDDGQYFANGSFATIYLAPSNYHRVHMPFAATLVETRYIPGSLFSVNHTTAQHIPDLFARNERLVCLFDSAYGRVAVVMVGAMIVAGIETVATGKIERTPHIQENKYDLTLQKGDELGRFYLGSTAIVILPKSAGVTWQPNMQQGEIVQMGERLGVAEASLASNKK